MIRYLYLCFLFICLTANTCEKEKAVCLPTVEEENSTDSSPWDTISYIKTFRNDVLPPSKESWRSVDISKFDKCQNILWAYLQNIYLINDKNYWDYDIYSISDEPDDPWERNAFDEQYTFFFQDTVTQKMIYQKSVDCSKIDTTFFLQTIGAPTCRTEGVNTGQITFFYYFKLKWRHGPCPNIFNQGSTQEGRCQQGHHDYCDMLKISFSPETGTMNHIFF